jgi:hypothetical protein
MTADDCFAAFLRRARAGDEAAARELVRQYEAATRLEVRVRLRQRRLRRYFDPRGICQSVPGSFFVRAAGEVMPEKAPEGTGETKEFGGRRPLARKTRRQLVGP